MSGVTCVMKNEPPAPQADASLLPRPGRRLTLVEGLQALFFFFFFFASDANVVTSRVFRRCQVKSSKKIITSPCG